MRRRRARQGGQILPLVALLMVVLTGFAALAIDAGMGYDQQRTESDVADAASLAAVYYLAETEDATLAGAYAAALNIAELDGCTGGSCTVPDVSGYQYLELWTSSYNPSSPTTPGYYLNSSGNCSSTLTGSFSSANCPNVAQLTDIGAPASGPGTLYFAKADGGKAYTVTSTAVASLGGGQWYIPCAVCLVGSGAGPDLSISDSMVSLNTNGQDIDVDGTSSPTCTGSAVWIDTGTPGNWGLGGASGHLNLETTNTNGWPYTNSWTNWCWTDWGYASCNSGGFWGWGWSNACAQEGVTTADPLAGMPMPSTTGLTNNGSPTYSTTSGCPSQHNDNCTGQTITLSPGAYGTLTLSANDMTVEFEPGLYVFAGNSATATSCSSQTIDGGICLTGGGETLEDATSAGVTLDFVCGTSSAPASCSSSGQQGAQIDMNTTGESWNDYSYGYVSWQLTAQTSGLQANVLVIYDRHNDAPINLEVQWLDSYDASYWGPGLGWGGQGWTDGAIYAPDAAYDVGSVGQQCWWGYGSCDYGWGWGGSWGWGNQCNYWWGSGNWSEACEEPLGLPLVVGSMNIQNSTFMLWSTQADDDPALPTVPALVG